MTKIKCLICEKEGEETVYIDSGEGKNCDDAFYAIEQHLWDAHSSGQFEVVEE